MSKVTIQSDTPMNPIILIGKEAGICWNSDTEDNTKNLNRGIDCIKANHGRTLEFAQIYMVLDGYSARVMRELYTHIAGSPTRLQSSTRYIDYSNFEYVTPSSIAKTQYSLALYEQTMQQIQSACDHLEEFGVPREDVAMLLPLGMTTKVVIRTNLRQLIDMSKQRLCSRAYWEFRNLMNDIINALREYGDEWKYIADTLKVFHPKCEDTGYCTETKSCGRKEKRND